VVVFFFSLVNHLVSLRLSAGQTPQRPVMPGSDASCACSSARADFRELASKRWPADGFVAVVILVVAVPPLALAIAKGQVIVISGNDHPAWHGEEVFALVNPGDFKRRNAQHSAAAGWADLTGPLCHNLSQSDQRGIRATGVCDWGYS
jgi:hypothetical protein